MELVYLWVDEYKNIKNQGFSFSPWFECKYDKDSNELTIEPKEYTSIFPNNINVTAIVGENGSGKSSLLEAILQIVSEINTIKILDFKYILISLDDSNICINTNIKMNYQAIKNSTKYNQILNSFNKKNLMNIHAKFINFNVKQKNIKQNKYDNPLNPLRRAGIDFQPVQSYNNFIEYELLAQLFYVLKNVNNIKTKFRNIFYPNTIKLNVYLNRLNDEINKFNDLINLSHPLNDLLHISFDIKNSKNSISIDNKNIIDDILEKVFHYIEISHEIKFNKNDSEIVTKKDKPQIIFEFKIKKIDDDLYEIIKDFLLLFQVLNMNHLEFDIQGTLNNDNLSYNNLSNGEKDIISITTLIESNLDYRNNYFILFDETFNTLHPNWQKKLLNYLIESFKDRKQKIHFIFTTHSPFLLSDLPKKNVIFLEKGKQVYPDIETFGANIHTLLSHGFFMKDGLMGEFAKGKIDEAIKILNQKQLNEEEIRFCENIISIVGEPILKHQMQKIIMPLKSKTVIQ